MRWGACFRMWSGRRRWEGCAEGDIGGLESGKWADELQLVAVEIFSELALKKTQPHPDVIV